MIQLGCVRGLSGTETTVRVAHHPDKCPICHKAVIPIYHFGVYHGDSLVDGARISRFQALYQCPTVECQMLFIATFTGDGPINLSYDYSEPVKPKKKVFPKSIEEISPEFCDIYNEANHAEQLGLKKICGPGYRKALEFLIKDYLIHEKPEEKEKIECYKTTLGNCIKEYIADEGIKACAERSAWLGNDETHYNRRWGDKDIEDFKNLIEMTSHWIALKLGTKKYSEEMTKGGPTEDGAG